jgi:hypothetical protein
MSERIPLDTYVLDVLMPDLVRHDRRPAAYLVYLYLWRRTDGGRRKAAASYQMISDGTGLSKRGAQEALRVLVRRQLVAVKRKGPTATPIFALECHWRTR